LKYFRQAERKCFRQGRNASFTYADAEFNKPSAFNITPISGSLKMSFNVAASLSEA